MLVRSHYGLIYLDTEEEDRAQTMLRHLADQLNLPYFAWTSTKGLRRLDSNGYVYGSENLANALSHIEQTNFPAIYHLEGMKEFLPERLVDQRLKDTAQALSKQNGAVVITGGELELPDGVKQVCTRMSFPAPGEEEYQALIQNTISDMSERAEIKVELAPEEMNRFLNSLKGLTLLEAKKIITRIIVENGGLTPDNIKYINDAKKEIIEREGLLEYYPARENMDDIADLKGLKAWLAQRREMFQHPDQATKFGLSFPKGVLLLGVQGCGKSLCAKAVGQAWDLPLLKFDPSNLYNKYVGESEKNFKRAMRVAEQVAPVVLWIDEIEKAFSSSGGDEDGGASERIFGMFLTWLQDKKDGVFVIATANSIERLPPEFLRKGRFDEIFFVDLPTPEARQALFEIHLRKRGRDPGLFNLQALAQGTEGFSGAEIEQAIVSGLYDAFSKQTDLTDEILVSEIHLTRPMSQTMSEKISALRDWAKDRTVSAQ